MCSAGPHVGSGSPAPLSFYEVAQPLNTPKARLLFSVVTFGSLEASFILTTGGEVLLASSG